MPILLPTNVWAEVFLQNFFDAGDVGNLHQSKLNASANLE